LSEDEAGWLVEGAAAEVLFWSVLLDVEALLCEQVSATDFTLVTL